MRSLQMSFLSRIRSLARYLMQRERIESDLDEELRSYVDLTTDEEIAAGVSEGEARRAAMVEFGGVEQVKQLVRERRAGSTIEALWQDVRYSVRRLRRSPGFALTTILTLAAGIASVTAVFSILDAVLLRPLPFRQPDRLVAIAGVPDETVSVPTIRDWQQRGHSFELVAAFRGWSPEVRTPLGSGGDVLEVSQNFFSTLGVVFAAGRDFPQTGNEQDCTRQAVISGGLWKRLGGGDDLSRGTLEIDHHTFQIGGVLPVSQTIEGSYELDQPDIFVPLGCDSRANVHSRGDADFSALARLRPGISISAATVDLARVSATLRHDFPQYYGGVLGQPPVIEPWITKLTGTAVRTGLFATFGACGLLLLITCANLANLLLARNVRRGREFAIRATLGASFRHLLRQLLAESAVLTLAGSVVGTALGYGALHLLLRERALRLPRLAHAAINLPVLTFVVCLAIVIAVLLAWAPALRTLRPTLQSDLAGGGRASADGGLHRLGRMLIAAQIALSLVLMACAGWMITGVYRLLHQPLGFRPDHLLMAGVNIEHSSVLPRYDAAQTSLYFRQLVASLRALPGVTAAAAVKNPPLGSAVNRYGFCSDAHPDGCRNPVSVNPDSYDVTAGYFAAIEQPVLEGRAFTDADGSGQHVVIVNRLLADREWPGQSAVGHRIWTGELQGWATVIGVVGNVHSYDLDTPPGPDLYLPAAYQPPSRMVVLMRTAGDPRLLVKTVRNVIRGQHADLSIYHLRSMEEEMANEVELRSFLMQVAAAFGVLALVIAVLGTYGLLAYEVTLREKEIGIRLALGSSRAAIVRLLLTQEFRWVAAGAGVGLIAATLSGYVLRSQFYQVQATFAPVLVSSLVLLVMPSIVAIVLPARRAAHLDPVVTLRHE